MFIESVVFWNFVFGLIVLNVIMLGLEIYFYEGFWFIMVLLIVDCIVVLVFVFEIFFKLFVYCYCFFMLGWNWFDLIVIGVLIMLDVGGFVVLCLLCILWVFCLFLVMLEM